MHRFASVAVVDGRGRVLMQERDEDAPLDPDRWGLPGGDLEAGEEFRTAAARELAEETGLGVGAHRLSSLGRTRFHRDACGGIDEFELFAVHLPVADADVTCGEGRQMVFVDPGAIHDLDLLGAARLQLPEVLDWSGYRDRFGGSPARRFSSVLLVDTEGRILLQERDEHPVIDPEKWGFAGGHVEDGETFLNCAVRELAEETGVVVEPAALTLHGEYRVDHRHAYGSFDRMRVFAAPTVLGDADIDCREGRRIVFVEPSAARVLDLTAAAADVVPAFLDSALYAQLR